MKLRFYIALVILLPLAASAQQTDSVKVASDSARNKFLPTGVRIGTDLISIGKSQYVKSFTGWEVNADVDLYRYFLTVDYGSWGRTYTTDSLLYKNTGKYYRIGVDVNFLKKDTEKNAFFIGMRYGHSTFDEDFKVDYSDPTWGFLHQEYKNTNVKAHWLEMTTGIKVKMWKFIWMGYTARYKFALSMSKTSNLKPSDVPGFGRTDKPVTWGFNYQLFFRIPVTKNK